MRHSIRLMAAVLIVLGGCESRPDGSGPPGAEGDTTDVHRDTGLAGVDTSDVRGEDVPGQDARGSEPDDRGEAGTAGASSLGISLQRLIDSAQYRGPGEEELAVLDRLNNPDRVTTDTQPNRHVPGQTDTLQTLHYENVRITVYKVSDGKELLHSVEVTGPELQSPEGLRVGMTRADAESALGEPSEHQNGAYIYPQNGPMPRRLHVHFDNDVVSRLEWRFPID